MATQRQIYLQKAVSSLAALLILLATAVQSQSPDLSEPTLSSLHTNVSMEEPRVLRMHRPCGDSHADYCVHGKCMFPQDSAEPACMCDSPYKGERCLYIGHVTQLDNFEGMIGMIVGGAFLICFLIIVLYCCFRGRCKRPSPPYKAYGSEESV